MSDENLDRLLLGAAAIGREAGYIKDDGEVDVHLPEKKISDADKVRKPDRKGCQWVSTPRRIRRSLFGEAAA